MPVFSPSFRARVDFPAPPQPMIITLSILFTHKTNLAHAVTLGNGLGQLQLTAEAFGNAPVTAHGMVTQAADFLVGQQPGLYTMDDVVGKL